MSTLTTTASGDASGKQIQVSEVGDLTRIQEILTSTTDILSHLFPVLYTVPNIVIYCMNTWQAESGFNCFPNGSNSRHSLVTGTSIPVPDNINAWPSGRSFFSSYWEDTLVKDFRALPGNDQSDAILDGLYAHGVSAVMGAYHIEGSAAYRQIFGSPVYLPKATDAGLIVTKGTRVTSLYTEDQPGRYKSILAGIIVLDYWYNYWGKKRVNLNINILLNQIGEPIARIGSRINSRQAILLATGSYLGFGADINSATGQQRAAIVKTNRQWTYSSANSGKSASLSTGAAPANPTGCIG